MTPIQKQIDAAKEYTNLTLQLMRSALHAGVDPIAVASGVQTGLASFLGFLVYNGFIDESRIEATGPILTEAVRAFIAEAKEKNVERVPGIATLYNMLREHG